MYHVRGQKFSSINDVQQKVTTVGEHWSNKFVPAICQLAKETEEPPPLSDLPNDKHALFMCTYYTIHEYMHALHGISLYRPVYALLDNIVCETQATNWQNYS